MLLTSDGWQAGCISGGCLESDIIRKAWWRTDGGRRVVVTYDSTDEEDGSYDDALSWGLGLGCNGIVEVMLERLTPDDSACPVLFIGECLQRRRPGVMATIISDEDAERIGERVLWHHGETSYAACTVSEPRRAEQLANAALGSLRSGRGSQLLRLGTTDVFVEAVVPPTPLLICGANHDAAPLTRLAKSVGWHVTVVDPWVGTHPRLERFPGADAMICCAPADLPARVPIEPGSFAVIMSHNVAHDAAFLNALLPSPVAYIGLLGPRKRTERLLAAVAGGESRHSLDDERLHGPIGLDIGAEDPETIALSILAEMQAVKSGRAGGFLRKRQRPIHDASTVSRHVSRRRPAKA
jgi:xanthine/CO dehydrogenase XdhC/CoxF family maturation factor